MVTRAPASSGVSVPTTMALTWKRGRTSRLWSVAVMPSPARVMAHIAAMFAWSSITPFGRPVVPLV